jgi:hypothetical protein
VAVLQDLEATEGELETAKAGLETLKAEHESLKVKIDETSEMSSRRWSLYLEEFALKIKLRDENLPLEASKSADTTRIAEPEMELSEARALAEANKNAQEKLVKIKEQWASMSTMLAI